MCAWVLTVRDQTHHTYTHMYHDPIHINPDLSDLEFNAGGEDIAARLQPQRHEPALVGADLLVPEPASGLMRCV
jgi:hypothetical protein